MFSLVDNKSRHDNIFQMNLGKLKMDGHRHSMAMTSQANNDVAAKNIIFHITTSTSFTGEYKISQNKLLEESGLTAI